MSMNDGLFNFDLDVATLPGETLSPLALDDLASTLDHIALAGSESQPSKSSAPLLTSEGLWDLTPVIPVALQFVKETPQWDGHFVTLYQQASAELTDVLSTQFAVVQIAVAESDDHGASLSTSLPSMLLQSGTLAPVLAAIRLLIDSHSKFLSALLMAMSTAIHAVPADPNDQVGTDFYFENHLLSRFRGAGQPQSMLAPQQPTVDLAAVQTALFVTMGFITFVENTHRNQASLLAALFAMTNGIVARAGPDAPHSRFQTAFPATFLPQLPPSPHFLQLLTFATAIIPPPQLPEQLLQSTALAASDQSVLDRSSSLRAAQDGAGATETIAASAQAAPGAVVSATVSPATVAAGTTAITATTATGTATAAAGDKVGTGGTNEDVAPAAAAKAPKLESQPVSDLDDEASLYTMLPHLASRLHTSAGLHPSRSIGTLRLQSLALPIPSDLSDASSIADLDLPQLPDPLVPFVLQSDTVDSYFCYLGQFIDYRALLATKAARMPNAGRLGGVGGRGRRGPTAASRLPPGHTDNNLAISALNLTSSGNDELSVPDDAETIAARTISVYTNLPLILTFHAFRTALLFGQYDLAYVLGSAVQAVFRGTAATKPSRTSANFFSAHSASASLSALSTQLWFLGLLTGLSQQPPGSGSVPSPVIPTQRSTQVTRSLTASSVSYNATGFPSLPPIALAPAMLSVLHAYHDFMTNTAHTVVTSALVKVVTPPPSGAPPLLPPTAALGSDSTPHLGLEAYPDFIAGINLHPIQASASTFTTKRPHTNSLQCYFRSLVLKSTHDPLLDFLTKLFPPDTLPFSLLLSTQLNALPFPAPSIDFTNPANALAHFDSQPHLFAVLELAQNTLTNHFKSLHLADFLDFLNPNPSLDGQTAPSLPFAPSPSQLTCLFQVYSQWVQNKAYYPHSALVDASRTNTIIPFASPLQILTQGPVYAEPRLAVLPAIPIAPASHSDHTDNGNNSGGDDGNGDRQERIVTMNLSRSATSSLPTILASTALVIRHGTTLQAVSDAVGQWGDEYLTALRRLKTQLEQRYSEQHPTKSGKQRPNIGRNDATVSTNTRYDTSMGLDDEEFDAEMSLSRMVPTH